MDITANLEDYLKNIYVIKKEKGICRVKDLALLLEIKPASVLDALANLRDKNLVVHERYGHIDLTRAGLQMAKEVFKRHHAVEQFFHNVLGLDILLARADACKVEHYLSKETTDRIFKLVKFIDGCPDGTPMCLNNFYDFVNTDKVLPCAKMGK